jgi:signal transduction histidine kinase
LAVTDNGKGIPQQYLTRVIEPLFSTKNNNLNFGLGLSYCYNVIRQHGGILKVNSKENEGTTVKLYFPKEKEVRAKSSIVAERRV